MAEALWRDDVRERTLTERMVVGMRMAQAEEWDTDMLPDVDEAMRLFDEFLAEDVKPADGVPDEKREARAVLGLGR